MSQSVELISHLLRTAFRRTHRHALVSVSIVLSLSVAIGSTAAIFSFEHAVDVAAPPYRDSDRLVAIDFLRPFGGFCGGCRAPLPNALLDRVRQIPGLQVVAAYRASGFTLRDEANPEFVRSIEAGPGFFDVLGVEPFLGRAIKPQDFEREAEPVLVASHQFWLTALHGTTDRLGQPIAVISDKDGHVRHFRLIGVMPERFDFPANAAVWVTPFSPENGAWLIGKTRPGVNRNTVQVAAASLVAAAATDDPMVRGGGVRVSAIRQNQHAWMGLTDRRFLLVGVVLLTLLLACTNVVTLLLGRLATARDELATRLALGATSTRLVLEVFVELCVLGILGASGGLLVAQWMLTFLNRRFGFVGVPLRLDVGTIVFDVVLGLAISAAVCFVVATSLRHFSLVDALRGPTTAGNRRVGLTRSAAILLQVSGAVVMLTTASQAITQLVRAAYSELGFDPAHLVSISFPTDASVDRITIQRGADSVRNVVLNEVERFGAIPEVTTAAVQAMPNVDDVLYSPLLGDSRPSAWDEVREASVTENYFLALRLPVTSGRAFAASDAEGTAAVGIVNQSGARRLWPGDSVLGKRVLVQRPNGAREQVTIVGVIPDVGLRSANGSNTAAPILYRPFRQLPSSSRTYWLRSRSEPRSAVPNVLRAISDLRPSLPRARYPAIWVLSEQLQREAADPRLNAIVLIGLAIGTGLLAAIGISGVVAHAVSQRSREIAIRVALGASREHVLALVAGRTVLLGTCGVCFGVLGTVVTSRLLLATLNGVETPRSIFIAMSGALAAIVVALAAFVPAMRALRLRPADALRI